MFRENGRTLLRFFGKKAAAVVWITSLPAIFLSKDTAPLRIASAERVGSGVEEVGIGYQGGWGVPGVDLIP